MAAEVDGDRLSVEGIVSFLFLMAVAGNLSFGRGVHFCLGANLARMETRICLEELCARMHSFELDLPRLVRAHSGNVRGFMNMPVRFKAA
jgi:cytochrome P450